MSDTESRGRDQVIQFLGRFVPVVGRGLALGFAILTVATVSSLMGDYPTPTDRSLVSALYAVIAIASYGVSRAAAPILSRLSGDRR